MQEKVQRKLLTSFSRHHHIELAISPSLRASVANLIWWTIRDSNS